MVVILATRVMVVVLIVIDGAVIISAYPFRAKEYKKPSHVVCGAAF